MRLNICLLFISFSIATTALAKSPSDTPTTNEAPPGHKAPTAVELSPKNQWYSAAAQAIQRADSLSRIPPAKRGAAKNIILFVGDGMGVSTVTAARILEGQLKGLAGEENLLSFEQLPHTALIKTYNVDAQTPDSAGTMTALMTGVKTNSGLIGLSETTQRGDCSHLEASALITSLELAELAGMSTGIISTARITHATPAATYAKSPDRSWEDINVLPKKAQKLGCRDIAEQLIYFEKNLQKRYPGATTNGMEVTLGGGRRHFLPQDASLNKDVEHLGPGLRNDNRDLIDEWRKLYPKGQFIYNDRYFRALDWQHSERVLGLFSPSHMRYDADRRNRHADEPSLSEMTEKAIELLDNNKQGYFLMVEGGRIDHAHHAGNAYNALMDTIEFARAVAVAMNKSNNNETLILVTADHSHVFTIAGYPKRGNPILGKVVGIGEHTPTLALDNKPYTTLGYMNGLGFHDFENFTDADAVYKYPAENRTNRPDLTKIDTTRPGFHQEAHTQLSAETHGGEDVVLYGSGPGAHLVSGTLEQNMVFHIMEFAADLRDRAQQRIAPRSTNKAPNNAP